MRLPPPSCPDGYTINDLVTILGSDLSDFHRWFAGQTGIICDGRQYSHEEEKYHPTACAPNPHGFLVFASDLERYARRLP